MVETTSEILCDLTANLGSDLEIVQAAQVSFDNLSREMGEREEGILRFLMKNKHGSPFEHNYFRFSVELPIFVVREHHRHRIGHSYNEMSGRYTKMEPKFYLPDTARVQHGKPGAYTFEESEPGSTQTTEMRAALLDSYTTAWHEYEYLLSQGIAKEQARLCLPTALYTKMWWSCNARSLMHFLKLRTDPTAMKEIRLLASQAEVAFAAVMPLTYDAWMNGEKVAP